MTQVGERATPARSARGPGVFERLAGFGHRRRWTALVLWVLVLVGVTAASTAVGSDYHNDFSLPGSESQQAHDTLRAHASTRAGDTVQVVVHDPDGLRDPRTRQRVEAMLGEVRGLPHVADVRSPYADASLVSRDGTIAYAPVTLDGRAEGVPAADVRRIIDTARDAQDAQDGRDGGLRVEVGGDAARSAETSGGGPAEGVGILGALVVLVLLFGSLVAASLPIVTAVLAVGSTVGVVALVSHLTDIADFTPPVMVLVGLGVGIDYALLVFSRYRGELVAGAEPERAARTALDTAGRTVFFASGTVVIALLGLVALGLGSFRGLALSVTLTVLTTMVASLTLLPALLAVFGRRIRRTVARRAERAARAARAGRPRRARRADGERWRRWAAGVQRRPWLALLVPVAALLALSAPALGLRLGFSDAGTDPAAKTSRQAYDLLAEGFGPGVNGPLLVVVQGDRGQSVDRQDLDAVRAALAGTPGVAAAVSLPPERDGSVGTVLAIPDSAPQDEATADLVDRLRGDVLPPLERRTGTTLLVGGGTAAVVDFADTVSGRLPLFVGIVVGLSALLLMVVFRSLLVPLKAALLNLLSIGAALGVMTAVFQNGVLGAEAGPVEAFIPVMVFAIVFGLSMDYEVFLLSRIHEEWERGRDARRAVGEGLASTGRVITAAAAIMIVVFGAFVLDPSRMLQQFGLGLAVAILLDAVVIRCLVVPAVMQLFGTRAWWLPGWLARRLPRVALEHR